jgi:hypothetical protein
MNTFKINERFTKKQIIEGAYEYINQLEENTCSKTHIRSIAAIAFVIGVLSGLGI